MDIIKDGVDMKVLEVKRPDGRVNRVQIEVGPFEIFFNKVKGRVRKTTVKRLDKCISSGPEDFRVPPYMFNPAIEIARGIFASSRPKN